MRRGQYFSGNYGSALGSTANAANLIAQAGQAQGQMYANLGAQIGGAIEKYAQNKKEGEAADMQIGAILQNMTPERQQEIASGESELGKSLSKFIEGELPNSKKKALLGSLMTVNTADQLKRKEQMDAQRFLQQQELINLNTQIARQNLERQKYADQLAKEEREKTTNFLNYMAQPGPAQIDPSGPDRNSVLRNIRAGKGATPPARMVPGPSPAEQSVMSPQAKKFIRDARLQKQPMDKVLPMAKQIDQEIAQTQPKAMTPKELANLRGTLLDNKQKERKLELPVLTEGEQVIDELVAKEYTEYVNLGGKSAVQSKIKKLNKAIQDLEGSDDLNSWLTGVLPESMKALFNEKGLSVQQAVESVIQENLRETLGAQFAQKEGEMFMARGYDAKLSDEVNIERVKSLLKEIQDRASARTQTFDYFKKNKTMKGYDGPVFNESSQPSPSSSFDPQEIDRLYEEKMRLGKARGLR